MAGNPPAEATQPPGLNGMIVVVAMNPRGASSGAISQSGEPWRKKGFVSSGFFFCCRWAAPRG